MVKFCSTSANMGLAWAFDWEAQEGQTADFGSGVPRPRPCAGGSQVSSERVTHSQVTISHNRHDL